MKIALLTRNPKLYSHQRLIETAEKRGHQMVPIDYLKCYMNITSKKPELRYLGEKLEGFDAVIPRIGASHTF
jgi:ribosomal protein S6--L-glutamate ligase